MLKLHPFIGALIGLPPQIMLVATLIFIVYVLRRDFRERPDVTSAIWLPTFWLFIIASRPVSKWLNIFGIPVIGTTAVQEGSSFDALVFLTLMALGAYILAKRQVSLSDLIQNNPWLVLFVFYCFLAIVWSDYPLVSFKRWIKILGHPIMVLILFTEPNPRAALVTVMRRCAYVIFPVSILWIKYFITLGKVPSEWGIMANCGIAEGKNELGSVCLAFGLFFAWYLLQALRTEGLNLRSKELRLIGLVLLMIAYCLHKAHSSTSTLSLLLGGIMMVFVGLRFVDKKIIGVYVLATFAALTIAQLTFDIYGSIVELTGHESTIEGRGRLWEVLLQSNTNPIFGTGFESYWLGDRVEKLWEQKEFWWHPTEAHNGYLEAYLNLGAVGLAILLALIIATFRKCRQDLLLDFQWGRLTMSYLIALIAHNWTEAGFKGLSINFVTFFLIAIRYPSLRMGDAAPSPETIESAEEPVIAYTEASSWQNCASA